MKNIIKYGIFALMSFYILTSCNPQESDDYKLGSDPTPGELAFSVTPSAETPNVLIIKNTSPRAGIPVWDLGNYSKGKGAEVEGQYPFKGEYTITMTLYTSGGSTSISKTITIADDDFALLDTQIYRDLTGGFDDTDGKTWIYDSEKDGHFGVGPAADSKPSWWSCPAGGKAESSLYKQEFTFSMSKTTGLKLVWKNEGKIYTNGAGKDDLAKKGYTNATQPPAGDWDVEYTPAASYTFTMNEAAKSLVLGDGAFFGHYTGSHSYDILDLNENVLYLKVVSTVESGNGWWYRLVPKK
ncbi:PKD domain-containing protein [Dysgonomonas sp. Marseille-P4677]|uniref:PKD domain-containing protein n=1 Tax=Dysgonomonas sp. Marseille-P4677 TaxID=2364790 RepID=UPI001911CD09|nr:PKD domain-containing protein [Dysgonomonas sp. Marseille-P4677]MBK5719671.1 PKD domain-containing protein [Dysgonomonas sp. Marseille-P4677]